MHDPRETFGPLSRYAAPLIGLTGLRGVGKTTAAAHLVLRYGFVRAHPLDGGKIAAEAYFRHLGARIDEAERMVLGDLRDVPSPLLPGRATPRYFLERFGAFMGVTLGPDWTLGAELARLRAREPWRPIVVESVVYEAGVIRDAGGIIVRIERPGHAGPAGIETDAAQAEIAADATIVNAGDVAGLVAAIDRIAQQMTGGR